MFTELITHEDPKSPISEVFKALRTNLQFMNNEQSTSILVTSTMPGEGKSWIASNIGVAFAQTNKKVVLIDSDMRKGRLHNIFDIKLFPGFSNYLSQFNENNENKTILDYVVETEINNLYIIPAGNVPPNPSELLSNEKMVEGIEKLKEDFDIIIFDSTPCLPVTDAIIISRVVDETIIVTSHKSTKVQDLKQVQKNIENVGGRIVGVVINKIPTSLKQYKSKYYYYGNREEIERTENIEEIEEPKVEEEIKEKEEVVEKIDNIELEKQEEKNDEYIDDQIRIEDFVEEQENEEIIKKIEKYMENKEED